MSVPELQSREELESEYIRRFRTYTDKITYFGINSLGRAMAKATGGLAFNAHQLYRGIIQRTTLMAAKGDILDEVMRDHGRERLKASRAGMFVIIEPATTNVDRVRDVAGDDYIEVEDATHFQAGVEFRINEINNLTAVATVDSVSVGTGPINGNDEVIVLGGIAGIWDPPADVDLVLRVPIAAGTEIQTASGQLFTTLESVITSDANPILDGASTSLALADVVAVESTQAGEAGNVEAGTITGFTTPISGVSVFNPERAKGGAEKETDYDGKYRTAHADAIANQETLTWVEALLKISGFGVLRAFRTTTTVSGTMSVNVLRRNGGSFSAAEILQMETICNQRVRSNLLVAITNVTLTSVEIDAVITLEPDAILEEVYRESTARLSDFLDFRKWADGEDVDEADLLSIVNSTPGVATLETGSFSPSSNVVVADGSLPTLVRVSLTDSISGNSYGVLDTLTQSFGG